MQRYIPGGWFFAVFELNGHSSSTNRIEMPVSQDYAKCLRNLNLSMLTSKVLTRLNKEKMLEMREGMLIVQHNSKPIQT